MSADLTDSLGMKRRLREAVQHCMPRYPLLICTFLILTRPAFAANPSTRPTLALGEVRMIWDAAPHNAFTDLTRFKNRWFCTFREASAHVSKDGAVRVLVSDDARDWKSAALLHGGAGEDLRELKFAHVPDGRLMLIGAACDVSGAKRGPHRSYIWLSDDGIKWSGPSRVAEENIWMWRAVFAPDGKGYCFGYDTAGDAFVRLYRATDPTHWETQIDRAASEGKPNESDIVFRRDGSAFCLLRQDGTPNSSLLGTSAPPYDKWDWRAINTKIGGPALIELSDGNLLAAVRLYQPVRTSLCWVDVANAKLEECLKLPSSGDTSYAGLVVKDGVIYVSYYSSHEGKTKVYLAEVRSER